MTVRILAGDCREVLATLPDESVDSIVTDPPYGLAFMGKDWDGDVPPVAVWRECLRVLKPGGYLLAFAGTRTQHRMAVRIEDAGFEIRDMIAWVYGSGFPKSLDVSKAIDKMRSEDVEPVRVVCRAVRAAMDAKGLKSRDLTHAFGNCHPRLIDHWAARDSDSQPSLPTWEQWKTLRDLLDMGHALDAEVWRLNGRKGKPGDAWENAKVVGEHEGRTPGFGTHRFSVVDRLIREPSDAAKQWQGWGTALKPALEPITVARKPLIGTVAENVLAHGTGALNIDGCRVPVDPEDDAGQLRAMNRGVRGERDGWGMNTVSGDTPQVVRPDGRWPANLIHDGSDEVVALFPAEAGAQAPVHRRNADKFRTTYGAFKGDIDEAGSTFQGDSGSAARFFYCAKATKADRGEGNTHPTVKPTALMRYLCRLVTPPGGTVLDPFAGSGSTLLAAEREGFDSIGIELNPEYVAIARRRIEGDAPLFSEIEA